ncbi:putative reverse transcriptase domain-containing protein [Tanacetum coccineum]
MPVSESGNQANMRHDNKKAKLGKGFVATNPSKKEYKGNLPKCATYCRAVAKQAKQSTGQVQNNPNQLLAIGGNNPNHGNNGNPARGCAYIMGANEAQQNPNVVSGLVGYYQRFIKNFSKIAKPFTLLTQKNKKFEWCDKLEEAFWTLKEKLCNTPVLALLDGPNDFVIYCDASNQGVKTRMLEAQSKASNDFNATAEMLRGLDKQLERRDDDGF